MKHCFIFNNLMEFAAAIELHDSDVQMVTLDKAGMILWLNGVFFPENSPVNDIAPCFAYGFPARILFSEAKLCPAPEDNKFLSLTENKDDFFEIISTAYDKGHVLLEGRFYTENERDISDSDITRNDTTNSNTIGIEGTVIRPWGCEASLEIITTGTIVVEWDDVCKEG